MATQSTPYVHRFACIVTGFILLLILVGAHVTSNDAGLAVPDYPTTFGYNMFLYPLSDMFTNTMVALEHSHRLIASFVGLLTVILAGLIFWKEKRLWVKVLGTAAVFLVILQGLLGGLRVIYKMDEIGILHACLAQIYFISVLTIAVVTSHWWNDLTKKAVKNFKEGNKARWFALAITGLIFIQLMIAATMRHDHAGLSVPDFPLAYGQVWPSTNEQALVEINKERNEVYDMPPTTQMNIFLHLKHRLLAIILFIAIVSFLIYVHRKLNEEKWINVLANIWLALVGVQIGLGALIIWTKKMPSIASLHVVIGALIFAVGYTIFLLGSRRYVLGGSQ
jgi:cytochrome c oxidase assembly protein subunit 15